MGKHFHSCSFCNLLPGRNRRTNSQTEIKSSLKLEHDIKIYCLPWSEAFIKSRSRNSQAYFCNVAIRNDLFRLNSEMKFKWDPHICCHDLSCFGTSTPDHQTFISGNTGAACNNLWKISYTRFRKIQNVTHKQLQIKKATPVVKKGKVNSWK